MTLDELRHIAAEVVHGHASGFEVLGVTEKIFLDVRDCTTKCVRFTLGLDRSRLRRCAGLRDKLEKLDDGLSGADSGVDDMTPAQREEFERHHIHREDGDRRNGRTGSEVTPMVPVRRLRRLQRMFRSTRAGVLVALVAASACHKGAPKDILTHGQKYYSQHNEELIIRHFFDDQTGGVFLDVGCWDWKEGSTTLYLEEQLGWSGIGVDAQADLRDGYEKHRPHTKFMNYIVTDHSGTIGKLYVAGQISSINETHVQQFPGAQWDQPAPIEVPTITLDDLLSRNRLDHIDFISIDIEGAEPKALAGFDIEKYKPRLVCIESSPDVRDPIMQYFTTHGYERIDEYLPYDSVNWYFRPVRQGFPVS